MSSYRISTNFVDTSESVQVVSGALGCTAIKAPKGLGEPVFISVKETQAILDYYGYPSVDYPAIQDVIDFNLKYPLWLMAPSTGGLYGGIFVTKTGSIPFPSGLSTLEISDWSAISQKVLIGTGTGAQTIFTFTLPTYAYYDEQSIGLIQGETDLSIDATDATTEVLTSSPDVGSGTLIRGTGALEFTFNSAPAMDEEIYVTYDINLASEAYMAIVTSSPQVDDLKVQMESTGNGQFNMTIKRADMMAEEDNTIKESGTNISLASTGQHSQDGFGRNIYAPVVFADSPLFTPIMNTDLAFSTFTDDVDVVALNGGFRGNDVTDSTLATAYDQITTSNIYDVNLFFHTEAGSLTATAFESKRATADFNRARFLLPSVDQSFSVHIADALNSKYNLDERGIAVYVGNWGIHKDTYQGNNFNCSHMGLIARKHAQIITDAFGGLAPAGVDENSMGGQLGSSIVKLNQTFTQGQMKQLVAKQLNPVFIHATYGPMIEAEKTTQAKYSDYSSIGHSGTADFVVQTIERQILPLQIHKLNNAVHRSSVARKCETILSTVSSAGLFEEFYIKCDDENNNATIKAQEKFVLTVGVKFTKFSKFIQFNFVNTAQGVSVKETIEKG